MFELFGIRLHLDRARQPLPLRVILEGPEVWLPQEGGYLRMMPEARGMAVLELVQTSESGDFSGYYRMLRDERVIFNVSQKFKWADGMFGADGEAIILTTGARVIMENGRVVHVTINWNPDGVETFMEGGEDWGNLSLVDKTGEESIRFELFSGSELLESWQFPRNVGILQKGLEVLLELKRTSKVTEEQWEAIEATMKWGMEDRFGWGS